MAIGTIIGGVIGSAAIATLNNAFAQGNQQTQFKQSRQLMQEQSQLNQEQWEKQFQMTNEYNSPQNQMALKQAAGLNPLFAEGNGMSNASPSGSVSLPSVGVADTPDYSSIISSIFNGLFQSKHLDNETKKTESDIAVNEADKKQKDAYVVNSTNLANSQIRVDNAKIKELLSQHELNEEQKQYVAQQTEANKELIKQKWHELELRSSEIAVKIREVANQEYTSRWQESVGRQNAVSNRMSAESSKKQADTAEKAYKSTLSHWDSEFKLKVANFAKDVNNDNIDNWIKFMEQSEESWNLGVYKGKSQNWLREKNLSAALTAFVQNCGSLNADALSKALPYFLDGYDKLNSVELNPDSLKSGKKNPYSITTPWFKDEFINQ